MIKIKINLGHQKYHIFLKYDIFDYIAEFHKKNFPGCKAIIITDHKFKKFN